MKYKKYTLEIEKVDLKMNIFKFFARESEILAISILDVLKNEKIDGEGVIENALDLVLFGSCKSEAGLDRLQEIFIQLQQKSKINFLSLLMAAKKIIFQRKNIDLAFVFCQKKSDLDLDFITKTIKKNFNDIGELETQVIELEKWDLDGFTIYFRGKIFENNTKNTLDNIKKRIFSSIDANFS